ncbi:sorting nexin-29-like [Mya arenaria]|uniref:sorting nexin-29-like n=1 Tax=Mya arenaria TaxID=6604 RepID=UPI0022E5E29A|nr:sorting nexin-29-like [Mya arenaria]
MNGDGPHVNERQSLQTRLLDAVKQCQVRFGGRTELATETDSRVSCLCSAWESVLLHGLRGETKTLAALKQVTEITGLNKVAGIFTEKPADKDISFWGYVKEVLTKHEAERFMALKNIKTDSGRGRAWLRASLNEHSLERYMHMLIENPAIIGQYYEGWSYLQDQEKSSMLPMMARGLDSILFAVTVDNVDLNAVHQITTPMVQAGGAVSTPLKPQAELRPVIAGESPPDQEKEVVVKKKEKKKKKKVAHIVSFDEDASGSGTFSRVGNYGKSGSFSLESPLDSPTILANDNEQPTFSTHTVTKNNIGARSDFQTINQSKSVTQAVDIKSKAGIESSRTGSAMGSLSEMRRNPSIASSRRSQGSIDSTDFELSMEISGAVMTPISPEGHSALNDNSGSYGSNSLSAFQDEDIQSATFALQQAQNSFNASHRTQGDGGNMAEDIHNDKMSTEELKKAVVSMMLRKDEVEEQNKIMKQMLEQEMETSSLLRAEIEDMKHQADVRQEKEAAKLLALQKENELLKHQLRKYVNAVQMLRTEGTTVDENLGIKMEDPQPSIPPEKSSTDYSHEAEEYEKKLIQVAEMHGELMEFNELLHRQLNLREHMLKRLQNELIDLRGPLPNDINFTDDLLALGAESLKMQQTTLINVWIPSAFLRGKTSDTHHVYQVYVRIRDEEWNVYKRYKQFNDLHSEMKKKYPLTAKFDFPPKKSFGKKDSKVVESRRLVLQTYLRSLINHLLEKQSTLAGNACKQSLLDVLPFFSDKSVEDKKKKKSEGSRTPLSSSPPAVPLPEQYGGL